MFEFFEREQTPGDVRSTLASALNGDLHYQHQLFTAMLDTWPKLQKAIEEIARSVITAPWEVIPYAERGDKPTPKAEQQAKEIEALIWGMKPRPARMENGLEETIRSIVRGYYYGHAVCEVRWKKSGGEWHPRCTKTIPARFYGYPYDAMSTTEDPEDRLMYRPGGMNGSNGFEDFEPNRFLLAINSGHAGHPSQAAPLRALAGYWLAAIYGLKWFMNFTQLFGIPWRHAEVGDVNDENAVRSAMANIGANGYIVTKPNTKINILSPSSTAGASLPQKELIALADQQCDQFILGQTLTGGTDGSGSRALGEVHQGTLDGVVDGVADFVGGVLTYQFIPAIVAANWGDTIGDELPGFWAKREEVKDEKALAERDEKIGITSGAVPVSKAWFYERHGIPSPADGDELLAPEPIAAEEFPLPAPDGVRGEHATGVVEPPHETKGEEREPKTPEEPPLLSGRRVENEKVKASEAIARLVKGKASMLTNDAFQAAAVSELESSLAGVPVVIRAAVVGEDASVEYSADGAPLIGRLMAQKVAYAELSKALAKP